MTNSPTQAEVLASGEDMIYVAQRANIALAMIFPDWPEGARESVTMEAQANGAATVREVIEFAFEAHQS